MKLIGSKTEQDIRKQLIKSNKSLFQDEGKKRLLSILEKHFSHMQAAYIIDWIPEQGEDIYKILINDDIIVQIELDRYDLEEEPIIETISVFLYRQGLSKSGQIKLEVAIDLARRHSSNESGGK